MSTQPIDNAMLKMPISLPVHNVKLRPFRTDEDFALIASIKRRCLQADRVLRLPTRSSIANAFASLGGFQPARDVMIAMQDDKPVGYVRLHAHQDGDGRTLLQHRCYTLPRMRHSGLSEHLLAYAEGRLLSRVIDLDSRNMVILTSDAYETEVEKWGLLERSGYRIATTYDDMVCDLGLISPPEHPASGWDVRPVQLSHREDILAWLQTIEGDALHPIEANLWRREMQQSPLLWWTLLHDDHIVGCAICRVDRQENMTLGRRRTYIDRIVFDPACHGNGGEEFFIASLLWHLKRLGLREAVCRVNPDHPVCGHQRLAGLGFRRIARYSSYWKSLN